MISLLVFVNFRLSQCEEDKVTKDSQIRSLKEEFANQVFDSFFKVFFKFEFVYCDLRIMHLNYN